MEPIDALRPDLRGSATWQRVSDHYHQLFAPGFGVSGEPCDPAIASDGSTTACTVLIRSDLESAPRLAVQIQNSTGMRTIDAPCDVRLPRFAQDGAVRAVRLAALADLAADGMFDVVMIDNDEIHPLPTLPGVAETIAWSPDGSTLLAIVADAGADAAGAQGSGRISRGDIPEWMPVVMGDQPGEGTPVGGWRRVWTIRPGLETAWSCISPDGVTCWEAVWCGLSDIVAIISDRPDEAAWFEARVARIDLVSRSSTTLANGNGNGMCVGLPTATPDGLTTAVVRASCSDRTVVAGDVYIIRAGVESRLPTADIDVTWQSFRTNELLVIAGQRGLYTVIAEVNVVTGDVSERWSSLLETCGQRYPEVAIASNCDAIAMVREGYGTPPELTVLVAAGPQRATTSLTHAGHHAMLESAGTLEPVAWTAPDGTLIDGLVACPAGEGPFPLITYVHGGPVWAWRSRWTMGYPYTALFVRNGFAVFHPNPRGSSGRGEAFRAAVLGDLGGAEAGDILSGIDHLESIGIADPQRLGVFGGSHGGFMAAWLITVTQRFGAAVPYCPVTEWEFMRLTTNDMAAQDHLLADGIANSPLEHVDRVVTPTLLFTGSRDLITPASQGLALHRALAERGVPTGYVEYPLEGHGVRTFPAQIDFSARSLNWFERFLCLP